MIEAIARRAVEGARGFTLWDIATMRPTDPTSEHFIHAEKLRQLRQQLAKTTDQLQRKEIARQIEEIEEGSNNQFQP